MSLWHHPRATRPGAEEGIPRASPLHRIDFLSGVSTFSCPLGSCSFTHAHGRSPSRSAQPVRAPDLGVGVCFSVAFRNCHALERCDNLGEPGPGRQFWAQFLVLLGDTPAAQAKTLSPWQAGPPVLSHAGMNCVICFLHTHTSCGTGSHKHTLLDCPLCSLLGGAL